MVEYVDWDFDYCMSTDVPYNTSDASSGVQWAEITAYAPDTFADLRSRFGIPEESFRQSILQSGPYVSFQSNSKGAARVGKSHCPFGVVFMSRWTRCHRSPKHVEKRWGILFHQRWSIHD
jgi:hypothetical protein